IVRGEGDLHQPRLARAHTDQLIFEAGKKRSRTDIDANIAAGATLERLAVDPAGKVDDHTVAFLDGGPLAFRRERSVLLGDLVERLLDLRIAYIGHLALELDAFEVAQLDLRQNFKSQRVSEVGLTADDVFDFARISRQGDLRLHGELEP